MSTSPAAKTAYPALPEELPADEIGWAENIRSYRVERVFLPLLKDDRDVVIVRYMLRMLAIFVPAAIALFWPGVYRWWMTPLYLAAVVAAMGPYTLMLHASLHRPPFRKEHGWLNQVVPWVLGPFFGQTPTSFGLHHIRMHHLEKNGLDDLSTTAPYQRDRFDHFLHYWFRFYVLGTVHLGHYFASRGRWKSVRRLLVGELSWLAVVVALGVVNPWATLTVLVAPLLIIRVLMMAGNWAQHAFVDIADPTNAYRSTVNLVNTPFNRRCFNDGYHIVHHLKPGMHWSEMPAWFEENAQKHAAEGAIVFSGVYDFTSLWVLLMTRRYDAMAEAMVDLDGPRTHEEKVALLKERIQPRLGDRLPGLLELRRPEA